MLKSRSLQGARQLARSSSATSLECMMPTSSTSRCSRWTLRLNSSAAAASSESKAFNYRTVAGVIVTRKPIITRDPSPFEKEFFDYQRQLEELVSAPFPADFYFKKGSMAEKRWLEQEAERKKKLQGPNSKSPKKASKSKSTAAAENVNDQESGKDENIVEKEKETSSNASAVEEVLQIKPRTTKADEINDRRALDRALQRTLYLIVKKPRDVHAWQFPQGGLEKDEYLHQAALRELMEECGSDIDVWIVGRAPIGHYVYAYPPDHVKKHPEFQGSRVYFMKAHIFAGQVNPDKKEIVDFAWVTKQELKEYVSDGYYEAVKDMLTDY